MGYEAFFFRCLIGELYMWNIFCWTYLFKMLVQVNDVFTCDVEELQTADFYISLFLLLFFKFAVCLDPFWLKLSFPNLQEVCEEKDLWRRYFRQSSNPAHRRKKSATRPQAQLARFSRTWRARMTFSLSVWLTLMRYCLRGKSLLLTKNCSSGFPGLSWPTVAGWRRTR